MFSIGATVSVAGMGGMKSVGLTLEEAMCLV